MEKIEEEKALRMSYWSLWVGEIEEERVVLGIGWVGGWVGGWKALTERRC